MKISNFFLIGALAFLTCCAPHSSLTTTNIARTEISFDASWNVIPDEKNLQQPSVTDILAHAAKVYANLQSYEDQGTITSITRSSHVYGDKKEFRTAFDKLDGFRFEFWGVSALGFKESPYVVWKNKKQVKTWWGLSNRLEEPEFPNAISGATGVSSNAAYFIPSVLIQSAAWKGYTWAADLNAYRISDITENKIAYYRVQTLRTTEASGAGDQATPKSTTKETFWIRKDNSLLTRVETNSVFPNFTSHTAIQYFPVINKKIPEASFEFGH
jgi:hypothetical protein